ncbi:Peptidoglycan/LPS O-acetylase OafA/YrhL, contains acyltransferase and SGNH-hydrolase domains [Chitinophaga costaii]|uniref:Peptidoglycan/LPS O-acetylase OafA/YrhL, contains acyltransferase and SGNH-hydrolase domains n=1 Tax=Chitinophaga costaii TaxID=1335309 RepID=A0A1C4F7N1_9BACT|nr:acyltransferase [Chitinophaga costaii]PUZ21200.1 acyltransferase [Chitinophaga costaii]SCC52027.1 Peptidoglycan/LPS O-acetylase OafA/YrhL, contains acyltransferase and SGNH-hydrolase domains [Chitinophaga costaii]
MNSYKRLYSLDYLRGLSAFGIMIYHLSTWELDLHNPLSPLGIFGVYGVSIFYVLSGLTLFHVYFEKMIPSVNDLKGFYLKRFFRIYPLLWLVIILTLLLNGTMPTWRGLLLNFTGAFGLIRWTGYYATGTWSIGNELVFYLFFPVFIFLSKKSRIGLYLFAAFLLGCFLYFPFFRLKPEILVGQEWIDYVNPLNQVFLFLGGYLIGYWSYKIQLSNKGALSVLLVASLIFAFYSPNGINVAAGLNRIVFSICCFLICFALYKSTYRFPGIIDKSLMLLGECSYTVYLLHPIVYLMLKKSIFSMENTVLQLSPGWKMTMTIVMTLVISYFVYHYFERYFMKLANSFSYKVEKAPDKVVISAEA